MGALEERDLGCLLQRVSGCWYWRVFISSFIVYLNFTVHYFVPGMVPDIGVITMNKIDKSSVFRGLSWECVSVLGQTVNAQTSKWSRVAKRENQDNEWDSYWKRLLYGDEISAEWRERVSHVKTWGKDVSGGGIIYSKCLQTGLILECLGQKGCSDFQEVVGFHFYRTDLEN